MAITFIERRKRLKYLVPILVTVVLITIFVLLYGFFAEIEDLLPEPVVEPLIKQKIEIDFDVLRDPIFEQLIPFEQIPVFEEEIGRENPFIPFKNNQEIIPEDI